MVRHDEVFVVDVDVFHEILRILMYPLFMSLYFFGKNELRVIHETYYAFISG
jgi:hypothetical protein